MTDATALPPTAQRYLEQIELRATVLPAAHRVQLLGQVTEHLTEALDDGDDVDAMLARLGSPRELVTAAIDEGFVDEVPTRRPNVLLWLGIAAVTIGVLLLAMGGGMIVLTGRWRSSLIALPGIVLAIGGGLLLLRQRRYRHARESAAPTDASIAFWLGVAAVTIGVLLLVTGGGWFLLTGRWRASLIALPGIVLAIAGAVALVRGAARPRRVATPPH